jgi:hypothetical protein
MPTVEELRADRFRFLKSLYEACGGDEYSFISKFAIGESLGFDRGYTSNIAQYLKGESLIEFRALGGIISISHNGIREVEDAISHPEQPTHYFPAVNNITIGTMINSSIQQASPDATQVFSQGETRAVELRQLVNEIKNSLGQLNLPPEAQQDVAADIATLEAQLSSSKPKTVIITESLATIRNVLEGVAGSAIATGIIAGIAKFLGG